MASVNKVIIVGNLGRDPETRYMPSGDAITNIAVATTDKWKDKSTGEQKEATEWHRISFFGRLAEVAGQYPVSFTHLRAHETKAEIVIRHLVEKNKTEFNNFLYIVDIRKFLTD